MDAGPNEGLHYWRSLAVQLKLLLKAFIKAGKYMDRSKIVAIITGAISLILAIAYLVIVQVLDFRGEMLPAPQSQIDVPVQVASISHLTAVTTPRIEIPG